MVVIDPDAQYTTNKNKFASKGRNTPFHEGKSMEEVQMTTCDGEIVYEKDRTSECGEKYKGT